MSQKFCDLFFVVYFFIIRFWKQKLGNSPIRTIFFFLNTFGHFELFKNPIGWVVLESKSWDVNGLESNRWTPFYQIRNWHTVCSIKDISWLFQNNNICQGKRCLGQAAWLRFFLKFSDHTEIIGLCVIFFRIY